MTVSTKMHVLFQTMINTDRNEMEIHDYRHGQDLGVITSRLNVGQIAILDIMAMDLHTSRSALIAEILSEAIPEAAEALCHAFSEAFKEDWHTRTHRLWQKDLGIDPDSSVVHQLVDDRQIDIEEVTTPTVSKSAKKGGAK